jgi:ribonucleotide reductase beta subunit family protein with ferritin-like domain
MYSLMIDTFVKNTTEKIKLFNGMKTIPSVKKKAEWAIRWIEDKDAPFSMRLLAFAIVEGIFFSGAFCSIFWLKERGLMPGLTTSNEFISRDEGLHTEFAILLYTQHLVHKLPQSTVYDIVKEAVDIEIEFITESLPCRLLGMNSDLMTNYIKFVADRLLCQMGYEKLYQERNPFPFMARINLDHKTNFFEGRESNYAKANIGGNNDQNAQNSAFEFTVDEDF